MAKLIRTTLTAILLTVVAVGGLPLRAQAMGGTPALPNPPSSYSLPTNPLIAWTATDLVNQLANVNNAGRDIVLKPGTYDWSTPFMNDKGNKVYSETLGAATLTADMVIGGNGTTQYGLVRGVNFNVSTLAKGFQGAMVNIWGNAGKGTQVLDSTFNGNLVMGAGVLARQPESVVVERVQVNNVTDYGVLIDKNDLGYVTIVWPVVNDVDVAHVKQNPPGHSDGRAEACIWLGNSTLAHRLRVNDCAWTGVWTGTANWYSVITDMTITNVGTGNLGAAIYAERFTTGTSFDNFTISGAPVGTKCEWDNNSSNNNACDWVVFQNATITSTVTGVWLDGGTKNTTVRQVKFIGQSWAGIIDNRGTNNIYNVVDPQNPNYDDCSEVQSPPLCVRTSNP